MNPDFERLIKTAIKDGIITDKEREILLRKAQSMGIDLDEAELIIESYVSPLAIRTVAEPLAEFDRFIKTAAQDGNITDKEKEILLRKAQSLGLDRDEAELLIESFVSPSTLQITNVPLESISTDAYDITDEELIIRCNRWINECSKESYCGIVEEFPKIKQEKLGHEKYLKIADDAARTGDFVFSVFEKHLAKFYPSLLLDIFGNDDKKNKDNEVDLDNGQIRGLAEAYLLLLEKRSEKSEYISLKHFELKDKYERKVVEFEEKKNQKKGFLDSLFS